MTPKKKEDLSKYYTYGLPLLGLMAVLAVIGVIITVVLKFFF